MRRTSSWGGARSEVFDTEYEPFRDDDDLQLQRDKVTGPFRFMNPTRALFSYTAERTEDHLDSRGIDLEAKRSQDTGEGFDFHGADVEYKWTSRNNRKGRHAIIIRESQERVNPYATPPATTGPRPMLKGIWRMLTVFTLHDVSYLLAVAFTLACVLLVINAILSFLPYVNHRVHNSDTLYRIQAILGALGCTLFFSGTLFAFAEAVNVNRRGCFGWKLVRVSHPANPHSTDSLAETAALTLLVPDGSCVHHHDSYKVVAGHPESWNQAVLDRRASSLRPEHRHLRTKQPWIWLPSWQEVRTHLRYDFGFVTATMLVLSSAVYCAMAWAALATVCKTGEVAPWIRFPQLVAALGFVASCVLSMIETQPNWWQPSMGVVGWHANAFNVVGSVGFMLTAVFGYVERRAGWAEYQYGCAFLWGECSSFSLCSLGRGIELC